jgi:hypothetical protein
MPESNGTLLQRTVVGNRDWGSDENYVYTLGNSKFCLVLRGEPDWSFRLCDAVYSGCIPVIITDMVYSLYHDLIDYTTFAVFIEEREVESIEKVLLSFSDEEVNQRQFRMLKIRDAFIYHFQNTNIDFETRRDALAFNFMSIALKSQKIFFE